MFQLHERVRRLLKWLTSPVPVRRGSHRFIPLLEALEPRWCPATYE